MTRKSLYYYGVVVAVQIVRPASDVSAGTWTTDSGASTNLFSAIDESVVNDADYIQSSLTNVTDTEVKVRLGALQDPNTDGGHTIAFRYKKNASDGDVVNLRVRLYDSDGTTLIAERTYNDIPAVETNASFTLTSGETNAISGAGYAAGLVLGFLRT